MQGYPITVYAHDVKADPGARGNDLGVVGGCSPELRPLPGVDRPEGPAEPAPQAALDLDEDQGAGLDADQIDLASGQAEVPGHDPIAKGF